MQARIALISEHASPLASPGSVDSGGQNVYVAQVAKQLSQLGFEVDVFTRRDCPDQLLIQPWLPGIRVIHVPAGPARYVPKEQMLPFMDQFADFMCDFIQAKSAARVHHWVSRHRMTVFTRTFSCRLMWVARCASS